MLVLHPLIKLYAIHLSTPFWEFLNPLYDADFIGIELIVKTASNIVLSSLSRVSRYLLDCSSNGFALELWRKIAGVSS
jgi:hypothetical protein